MSRPQQPQREDAYMTYPLWEILAMQRGKKEIRHLYPETDPNRQSFRCSRCPRAFYDVHLCHEHFESHITKKHLGYECISCGFFDLILRKVKNHIVHKHGDVRDIVGNIKMPEPGPIDIPVVPVLPHPNSNQPGPSQSSSRVGSEASNGPGTPPKRPKLNSHESPGASKPKENNVKEIECIDLDSDDTPPLSPERVVVNDVNLDNNNSGNDENAQPQSGSNHQQNQGLEEAVTPIIAQPLQPPQDNEQQESEFKTVGTQSKVQDSKEQIGDGPHSEAKDAESMSLTQKLDSCLNTQPQATPEDEDKQSTQEPGMDNESRPRSQPKIRFKESLAIVNPYQLLDYSYLGRLILGNIEDDEVGLEERNEPYIQLPKGCFNKSFFIKSIEITKYGPYNLDFAMEDLEKKCGAIIYSTPDLHHLPQQVIHGILESVGMLDKCIDVPPLQEQLEPGEIPDSETTGRIKVLLKVLGDYDTIYREEDRANWQDMEIVRTYCNNSLKYVTKSTSQSASVLESPDEWDQIPDELGLSELDFPYPKLLYMCESNVQWLWDQRENWDEMISEISNTAPFAERNRELYALGVPPAPEIQAEVDRYEFVIHSFTNVFKQFLDEEGLIGEIYLDMDDLVNGDKSYITDLYVKPRGLVRRDPVYPQEFENLRLENSEDERRTAAIALFFSFWSIMSQVPFLVCDLLNEEGHYIPIKGIKYYVKNLVVCEGKVNSTQQLFFTTPMTNGLRIERKVKDMPKKTSKPIKY